MGEPGTNGKAEMNDRPPVLSAEVILETLVRHRVRFVVIGALGATLLGHRFAPQTSISAPIGTPRTSGTSPGH